VLRTPYLEAARAELAAAQSVLENARVELGHTEIKAPYDGVIMERFVNPDETVFAGDEVAVLYSLSAVEVGAPLDADQWASLSSPVAATKAVLTDPRQKATWEAAVARETRHLDQTTRLRTLYLEVNDPLNQNPPLLPGTFVHVELTGKEISGLLCIPETAFTKEGIVWLVDNRDRLAAHETEPRFYGEGVVYIQNPVPEEKTLRVAVSPNSSYIHGLPVALIEEGGSE
jgi:RND family efflux transporter MFP subunit